jgi:hypothetical protein
MPIIRILPNAEFCPAGDTIEAAAGTVNDEDHPSVTRSE